MLEQLFESIKSDVLTEEVKLQMSTLFESALTEAVKAKEIALEEQNRGEIAEFKEDMVNQIDEYLNYFVEEFVTENESLIDNHVKVKTAERVLETFANIVTDFNLQLSEGKVKQSDELVSLKKENDALHNKIMESRKEVELVTKAAMIAEKCYELETEVDRDKLVQLAETVEFDEDTFSAKLDVFVEQITSASKKVEEVPAKMEESIEEVPATPALKTEAMKSYLRYL